MTTLDDLRARLATDADRCVKCALCLPVCPTYNLHRHEADGPRGRIAAAEALAMGRIAPSPRLAGHLDGCLSCRACEAVCPAGVPYGRLIVDTRSLLAREKPARLAAPRAAGRWLIEPGRRRWLWSLAWLGAVLGLRALARGLAPLLPERWARWLWLWPRLAGPGAGAGGRGTKLGVEVAAGRNHDPAIGATDPPMAPAPIPALFAGCTADGGPETAVLAAARRLAGHLGAPLQPVAATPRAGCCGALHRHAGDEATADRLAASRRAAFGTGAGATPALCTVSGCADTLEAGGTPVLDPLSWLLPFLRRGRFRAPALESPVALHTPCSQRLRPGATWEATLADLFPSLAVSHLPAACCGAAGSHLLTHPAQADTLAEPLVSAVLASSAQTVLSANVGCRLHLAARLSAYGWTGTVLHPLEYLDRRATG